jgi:hypothetical protein
MSAKTSRYDRDFYAWTREQGDLLRAGKTSDADLENLAEEIESMGKTEKRELVSRLTVLLFAPRQVAIPARRLSIEGQKMDIQDLLSDNPSLRPIVSLSIGQAWRRALIEAEKVTGLDASTFPVDCPWAAESDDFWPE